MASVVRSELQAVGDCRIALLGAVSSAEADGLTVDEHWAVLGSVADVELQRRHERDIGQCLSGLMRADATAAQAIARALDEFRFVGDDVRGFVPVAIGLAFLIDAAVSLLISAGVVSAGAILFALVDEFGTDNWDLIESAVPSSFYEDAGPVDESGVRERIQDATVPGRNRPVRQVATEEQLRDLWDELTAEGRVVENSDYPGKVMELPDGTKVMMRETSKSGGATLDIYYPGSGTAKVHVA
ncbi:hypothetical protein DK926_12965 [Rhodococcus sp. Eu-32]|uniref:hypothetical protein n=1 Tax=Rhodococcus sp. Eu-32 TaxID=1017319 RepID=UPI000DF16A33|nr:hypothetical protein [Rhodococcus sp. Eu-32]RRQ27397.1 hypothetical protein DK926_12965 [Rhodococcus sp. Eu-32]